MQCYYQNGVYKSIIIEQVYTDISAEAYKDNIKVSMAMATHMDYEATGERKTINTTLYLMYSNRLWVVFLCVWNFVIFLHVLSTGPVLLKWIKICRSVFPEFLFLMRNIYINRLPHRTWDLSCAVAIYIYIQIPYQPTSTSYSYLQSSILCYID